MLLPGRRLAPVHPGNVLLKDFIEPLGITRYKSGEAGRRSAAAHRRDCAGNRSITADTALRLARLFGTDAIFWINLQGAVRSRNRPSGPAQTNRAEVIPLGQRGVGQPSVRFPAVTGNERLADGIVRAGSHGSRLAPGRQSSWNSPIQHGTEQPQITLIETNERDRRQQQRRCTESVRDRTFCARIG